jgi:hypothetical protein
MKTKSLFIAALVTIIAMAPAVGKDAPRNAGLAVVSVKGSEVFKVIYKGEIAGKVKLSVYNAAAKLVFTETLSGNEGFIRPLNFSGLAFGEYTVEIVDAAGKRAEKVNYQPVSAKKNIHVSKVSKESGKFLISVGNVGAEKINVRIFDALNNLMYSEEKEITGAFAQIYSVKNFEGITFEVSDSTGNTRIVRF